MKMPSIGDRIRELRKASNLSQEEFGKMFGVVKSTVSLYESGKNAPDDQIKLQICKHYNVSMDWLFGLDDPQGDVTRDMGYVDGLPGRLNDLMREKHFGVESLRQELGISEESMSSLLKGSIPDIVCLFALANCFDVTTDYLLGRSPVKRLALDEDDLLKTYRKCNDDSKRYILSKAIVLSVDGIPGSTVSDPSRTGWDEVADSGFRQAR